MELFSVKRYTEDEKATESPSKEDEILQKLLKKVHKRKLNQDLVASDEVSETTAVSVKQDPPHETAQDREEQENDKKRPKLVEDETEEHREDFPVLGSNPFQRPPKVDMILPPWLAHPTVIETAIADSDDFKEDSIAESEFLDDNVKAALSELTMSSLFPVQKAVIPWVLNAHSKPHPFRPRDICVSAPTGSGKTLAFAIPVVQLLTNRVEKKIRALVVLPVAELALQVYKVFRKLTEKTDLSVCLLSKSCQFASEQQKLVEFYKGQYYSKVDIVITTPGRLVEHLHSTKGFCLKALKFLVIDEADRIMDQVYHNWLYHLDEHVKSTSDMLLSGRAAPLCISELENSSCAQPHKMLFSATLSQDPEKLQNLRLFQPKLFTSVLTNLDELKQNVADELAKESRGEFIGKYTTPAELTEKYCLTETRLKPLTLYSLITENKWTKFLCFTNSAEAAGRLAFVLKCLFSKEPMVIGDLSAALHNPQDRANTLNKFARGKVNGLICSDALARGIDVPDVDIVISYDPPRHIKTYIHRIGRTARAGRPGTAITLLSQKELNIFNNTLAEVGKVITQEIKVATDIEESNAKVYADALTKLRNKLEEDKHKKIALKNMAKVKAKRVDPSKMTVMEKLQAQATNNFLEKFAESQEISIKTNKKSMGAFKAKKAKKLAVETAPVDSVAKKKKKTKQSV